VLICLLVKCKKNYDVTNDREIMAYTNIKYK